MSGRIHGVRLAFSVRLRGPLRLLVFPYKNGLWDDSAHPPSRRYFQQQARQRELRAALLREDDCQDAKHMGSARERQGTCVSERLQAYWGSAL